MNGMERKVAERSAALECDVEKRKPLAAGFGRQIIHGLHLRRWPNQSYLPMQKCKKLIAIYIVL